MSFVQREIDRIRARKIEMLNAGEGDTSEYANLAAADQALSWASDPAGYMAPADFVAGVVPSSAVCPPSASV